MGGLEFIIEIISSFFEISALMIFLYDRRNSSKRYNINVALIIGFSLVVTTIINEYFDSNFPWIIYLTFVSMYSFLFKTSFFKSLIKFIAITFIIMPIQLLILYFVEYIYNISVLNDFYIQFLIAVATFLIAILVKIFLGKSLYKLMDKIENFDERVLRYLIINTSIYIVLFKVIWEYDYVIIIENLFVFVFMFLAMSIFSFLLFKNTADLIEKNKANEVQASLGLTISEMVNDIKERQHEYKNQINTILGIVEVSDEKLIKDNVKNYIKESNDMILEELDIVSIDNDILKAIMYMKISEAFQKGIKFIYNIDSNLENTKIMNYELTEILSNVINNAFEGSLYDEEPYVKLDIFKSSQYYIEISNNGKKMKPSELDRYLLRGKSSKGDGRGYGLYNVNKILNKNNGKILSYIDGDLTVIKLFFD